MKILLSAVIILAFVSTAYSAPCDNIKNWARDRQGVTITLAEPVAPGAFTPQGGRGADAFKKLPAFCRVAATISPVADSEIKIEVWLPESGWNGKLESVGNRNDVIMSPCNA